MAKNEQVELISLSGDAARAGVTGHHVREVLAYGLAGAIAAFAAIAIYFGYDRLTQTLSQLVSDPVALAGNIASYAVLAAIAATVAVLLLGLWNRVAGRSADTSQLGMRIRVVLQFVIICAAMAILYWSAL